MTTFSRKVLSALLLASPLLIAGAAGAAPKGKTPKKAPPAAAPAPPPAATPDVFANVAKGTKIRSFSGNLETPKVEIFPVKAGHCYVVVMRLAPGATMDRKSVGMDWPNAAGEQMPASFGAEVESATGAAFKPDCATINASIGVWAGIQSFDGLKSIGKGAYTFDVFERRGTSRELALESAADKKFHEESAKERNEARAKTCGECSSPVGGRKVCLERRGVTLKDCNF